MDEPRIKSISPVVDHYWPGASDERKRELTEELRPFFSLLYELFCRFEAQGDDNADSRENGAGDIVGVE